MTILLAITKRQFTTTHGVDLRTVYPGEIVAVDIGNDNWNLVENMTAGSRGSWKIFQGIDRREWFELIKPVHQAKEIVSVVEEYLDRQSRKTNPEGRFDGGGRWYPSDAEKCDCCEYIRRPSRAYPYSLMIHCRTLPHVCAVYGVDPTTAKRVLNKMKKYAS